MLIRIEKFTPWTDATRPDRWGGSAEKRKAARRRRVEQEKKRSAATEPHRQPERVR